MVARALVEAADGPSARYAGQLERSEAQRASTTMLIAVAVCCFSPLLFGFSLSFTSPTEGSMVGVGRSGASPPADLAVFSKEQESWYASLINIGAVLGAFLGSAVSDRRGRRTTLAMTAVPHLVAWLCTALSRHAGLLRMLRVLCGVGVGMGSAVAPCYIGEVSTMGLRGPLGAANQLSVTLGILVVSVVGSYGFVVEHDGELWSDWPRLAVFGFGLAWPLLAMLFMPDSPKWHARRGDADAARASLRRLRASDITMEVAELAQAPPPGESTCAGSARLLCYKRPLVVGIGLLAFQQVSGVNAIMMYTTAICQQADMENAELAAMVSMAAQVVFTGISCLLMERVGRRPLLLFGAAAMACAHLTLAFYFFARAHGMWAPSELALLALAIFIFGFSLGLGPVPWLILAEIFPTEVRSVASSWATATNWTCSFVVTLLFGRLEDAISRQGAFLLFAVVCVGCFCFVFSLVPETRGKSVEQVLVEMSSRRSGRDVALVSA